MDPLNSEALTGLTSALQSLLPASGDPDLAPELAVSPTHFAPTGLNGFVGVNHDPDGEIVGRRVKASAIVAVKTTTLDELNGAVAGVTAAVVGTARGDLRRLGILTVGVGELGDQLPPNGGPARQDVTFDVSYEFLKVPSAPEGVMQQIPIDLVAEMGLVGYWPRPGEPILFNQRNFPTCTMLTDIETTLGIVMGGGRARAIGALGAAQVDKQGNINSTQIPGETLLMGSGGANDVVTCAAESIVVAAQSKGRFVEQVPYITGPGDRVGAVVSTLGVFHKKDGELILTGVFGDDPIRAARECTQEVIEAPSREEIRMVRIMDPRSWFRG